MKPLAKLMEDELYHQLVRHQQKVDSNQDILTVASFLELIHSFDMVVMINEELKRRGF